MAADVTAVVEVACSTSVGDFYLNSRETRTFLCGAPGASLSLRSGLVANIGSDITWTFEYAGGGNYYIHPNRSSTYYLDADGTFSTEPSAWDMTSISNRVTLRNSDGEYLGVSGNSVVVSASLTSDQRAWRIVGTGEYKQLRSISAEDIIMDVGEYRYINYSAAPSSADWIQTADFIFTPLDDVTSVDTNGRVYGNKSGISTISIEHLPTGRACNVTVYVCEYNLEINHYYDDGLIFRWGNEPTVLATIEQRHNEIAEYLASQFLVNVDATYTAFRSQADEEVVAEYGELTLEGLNATADCTTRDEAADDVGVGSTTAIKAIWTGHHLEEEDGGRAASYGSTYVIILPHTSQSVGTLLHEVSHQLGTYDHYCEGDGEDGSGCSISTCDTCYKGYTTARTCIMTASNISNGYCSDCVNIIQSHLEDHH